RGLRTQVPRVQLRCAGRAGRVQLAGERARAAQPGRAHRHPEPDRAHHRTPLVRRARQAENDFGSLHEARSAYEREYIQKKLEENSGNMTRTAEVLGLERSHLYRKMKSLGMGSAEGGAN